MSFRSNKNKERKEKRFLQLLIVFFFYSLPDLFNLSLAKKNKEKEKLKFLSLEECTRVEKACLPPRKRERERERKKEQRIQNNLVDLNQL